MVWFLELSTKGADQRRWVRMGDLRDRILVPGSPGGRQSSPNCSILLADEIVRHIQLLGLQVLSCARLPSFTDRDAVQATSGPEYAGFRFLGRIPSVPLRQLVA